MLCLASFGNLLKSEPLLSQGGIWLSQDFDWFALGIVSVLALMICCAVAATGLALLSSLALLVRAGLRILNPRRESPQPLLDLTAWPRGTGNPDVAPTLSRVINEHK
jgi:hypothetical protein